MSIRRKPKSKYTEDRNIPGAFEGETVTRRRFMVLGANGAGAVAASAFALPAVGFMAGSALFDNPRQPWEQVGAPDEFPVDRYIPRVITPYPNVGAVGKTTVYVRAHNEKVDGPLERSDDDPTFNSFVAISTRCMHLGCPVKYVDASQRFICPCHGGVYDFRGARAGGPPVRPLDRFYTRVRNGQVEIGKRFSVNEEFKRFPHYRDPGEKLDGVFEYLFPGRFSNPEAQ